MDMDYIDIGVNLLDSSFEEDRDEVIDRAFNSNIRILINTSSSMEDSVRSLNLAKKYPSKIFTTAGIHPHNASTGDNSLKESLTRMLQNDCMVAIGECGLDYFRNLSPKDKQLSVFKTHLEVAKETGLPLFLHQRDAHEDFTNCLNEVLDSPIHGVAHCFTGNIDQMNAYLDMGLYIGITGWICDERRNADLIKAVKHLPLDKVLIETDSPYLIPRSLKNVRRNEPMNLSIIAEKLADEMGIEHSQLANQSVINSKKLFNLSI
tara:strand:+ start:978 stop:1766 length:789 start_codon:yes stop_codon:yes gene_type:complete